MKKFIKIGLLIFLLIILIIIADTFQAVVFKNSPIISFKYNNNDSWVEKGILVDTYYCVKEQDIITVYVESKFSKFSCPLNNVETENNYSNKKIIKIGNSIYYETSKESKIGPRCGNMDGYIETSVEYNEIPQLNNQSNFGVGYGYQTFGDIIEVFIDGKIVVFEKK